MVSCCNGDWVITAMRSAGRGFERKLRKSSCGYDWDRIMGAKLLRQQLEERSPKHVIQCGFGTTLMRAN